MLHLRPGRLAAAVAVALAFTLVVPGPATGAGGLLPGGARDEAVPYTVTGPRTFEDVNAIADTGASVDGIEDGRVAVTATSAEIAAIRALGFTATADPLPTPEAGASLNDFPPSDAAYHNYNEMIAEINSLVAAHSTIATRSTIGNSYQGRAMPLIKISDNVTVDENEPEVLFNAHQHAREHLTVEMSMYLLHLFLDNYGTDATITNWVNTREIWIVPDMNPDGGEYDIATGSYRSWRKNRQPNTGLSLIHI